jgi:5-methylthioadenosine/S-adenosylhomocysteine deaminase
MTTIIRNTRVLTMDDANTEHDRADILIEGATISAIGPDLTVPEGADARVIDGAGMLAMPGLVNGHFHSSSLMFKGAFEGAPLEIIMLSEDPPMCAPFTSHRYHYLRTMLGVMEMLKLGITAVRDDAFHFPAPTIASIDGIMQAYADGGMRAEVTMDQHNVVEYTKLPGLHERLTDDDRVAMEAEPFLSGEALLDLYRGMIERWHGACDGRLAVAVSCSAPQRVTAEYFQGLGNLSRAHDLAFNAHILETRAQRVLGDENYGGSLIRYVHDLGLLDERMVVIHAVWTDEDEWRLMADSGCAVAHNPISNLKLGSGIMPFRRLREHGIPICIGSDEASTDDTANLWQVAKTGALIQKIAELDYRHWPPAAHYLEAMTRGGARAMRRADKGGMLAPGRDADLILIDLDTLAFTPLNDLRRQLVFCENGSSVALTMVAGQVVAEGGKLLTVDEDAIKAELRALMPAYEKACGEIRADAARREPPYREVYMDAAARDVGFSRWADG